MAKSHCATARPWRLIYQQGPTCAKTSDGAIHDQPWKPPCTSPRCCRATAMTGTNGSNNGDPISPKGNHLTRARRFQLQCNPAVIAGSHPVSHLNRSLAKPGPSPPAQHPRFLIDCFPLAAQSDQGINIHALAPSRRATLPVCRRALYVFSECLDSALSQEKHAETGQNSATNEVSRCLPKPPYPQQPCALSRPAAFPWRP